MDGTSAKKSSSFETLVIQNITNVSDLKKKLNEIICAGKNYEFDVSACLKTLLKSSDQTIVLLSVQAISELTKCEIKRDSYANKEIIVPILNVLGKEFTKEKIELVKQCFRSLGNLCCDCDTSRRTILENNGIPIIINILEISLEDESLAEIQTLVSKTLLNYAIGGEEFSESLVKEGIIELQNRILLIEKDKTDMNDDAVITALLILSVINDNSPEFLFDSYINKTVLDVLRDTSNIEVSELCLEHLHMQAENDLVKTLLADESGIQLVCNRLEQLMRKHEAGELNAEDNEVEAVLKQACDLIIIVLTGDEAMRVLYNNGFGEVYLTMVRWLDSTNYNLLTTAVLAIGNFARKDDYCIQMMENKIYDKLLDIFEVYHGFCLRIQKKQDKVNVIDTLTVNKIQHAVLSAIRNLTVPVANKRVAAAKGKATTMLLNALPNIDDHQVAYKLLAAIRMLVDGQEGVARQLVENADALAAAGRWARAGHAGAEGEAPRLLARALRQLHAVAAPKMLQVDGCVSSLVGMLVASHSVMQNEAILALTLLAIETLHKKDETDFQREQSFVTQLIDSEIGKHLSVLIETNCAKMPIEVAENLLAFLDLTSKNNQLASDYKEAKVQEALQKFVDARKDFGDDLKTCIKSVLTAISDYGKA